MHIHYTQKTFIKVVIILSKSKTHSFSLQLLLFVALDLRINGSMFFSHVMISGYSPE